MEANQSLALPTGIGPPCRNTVDLHRNAATPQEIHDTVPLAFLLLVKNGAYLDTSTTGGAESFGEDRVQSSIS